MSEETPTYVFMPSLLSMLLRHEHDKGTPLTEEEVIHVRDNSGVIVVPQSVAVALAQKRGYDDIDPDLCWPEWQRVRAQLPGMNTLISNLEADSSL